MHYCDLVGILLACLVTCICHLKKNWIPPSTSSGQNLDSGCFSERFLQYEVVEEGLERTESPLTDSVASFLITIGWFVNIVPLWFNLLCAVEWKLSPEGCWRGLLIYLLCINNVFGRRVHPGLLLTKVNRETLTCVDPKPWDGLYERWNDELGDLRSC